jgi:hypothetical protein
MPRNRIVSESREVSPEEAEKAEAFIVRMIRPRDA